MASAAVVRRLQEDCRRGLKKIEALCREFDERDSDFETAAAMPDVEHVRSTGINTHVGSKAGPVYTNPARDLALRRLEEAHRKLSRLKPQVEAWDAERELRPLAEELHGARTEIARRTNLFYKRTSVVHKKALKTEALSEREAKFASVREWVQEFLTTVRERIDEAEAELETLAEGGANKREREKGEARLELLLRSRRAHEAKLEALTRLLDNELVEPAEAQELRYELQEFFDDEAAVCETEEGVQQALELYDSIELLRVRDKDEDEDGGDAEGAEAEAEKVAAEPAAAAAATAAAAGGSGGGGSAKAGGPSSVSASGAARPSLCRDHIRSATACALGRGCPLDHSTADKARALGACAHFLVGTCSRADCRRKHLSAEAVRAESEARGGAGGGGSNGGLAGVGDIAEALRPLVLAELRGGAARAGRGFGLHALAARPGVKFFLDEIRRTDASLSLRELVRAMDGVGCAERDGVTDVFELSAEEATAKRAGAGAAAAAAAAAPAPAAAVAAAALEAERERERRRDRDEAAAAAVASAAAAAAWRPAAAAAAAAASAAASSAAPPIGAGAGVATGLALTLQQQQQHQQEVPQAQAPQPPSAAGRLLDSRAMLDAARRLRRLRPPPPSRLAEAAADDAAPLLRAAREGDVALAAMLLAAGAPADVRDAAGRTPLLCACQRRREEVALALLAAGADANAADAAGRTPLLAAALFGLPAAAAALLAAGADMEARTPAAQGGYAALHLACAFGHDAVALLLLAAGADEASASASGATARALCGGHEALMPDTLTVLSR
jgi:hypothetical protein